MPKDIFKNFDFLKLKLKTNMEPIVAMIDISIGNAYILYKCDLISVIDKPNFL